jgi:phosphate transport system substrate-binding protein
MKMQRVTCLRAGGVDGVRVSIILVALLGLTIAFGCNTSTPSAPPPLVNLEEEPAGAQPAEPTTVGSTATDSTSTTADPDAAEAADLSGSNVVPLDPALPKYAPVQGVSGTIKSIGSDTMNNLMALWAGGFRKFYPAVQVEIEGKGTSTAPPALISGTANFGPMSRRMKPSEVDQFQAKFEYKPAELETAVDALAVYVNKDNPLKGLSLPQVDAIFSRTRKLGVADEVRTWDQLGLDGDFDKKPISLYGRNAASGTYGFFKEKALGGGDYKDSVKEQPGSSAVVQGVSADKSGMGYSGIGYITSGVRAVPLAVAEGDEFVAAEAETAYSGDYPLSRTLNVAINYKPGSELDPLRREFIKYIFSQEGQQEVIKDGYFPVTAEMARKQLQSVGIPADF